MSRPPLLLRPALLFMVLAHSIILNRTIILAELWSEGLWWSMLSRCNALCSLTSNPNRLLSSVNLRSFLLADQAGWKKSKFTLPAHWTAAAWIVAQPPMHPASSVVASLPPPSAIKNLVGDAGVASPSIPQADVVDSRWACQLRRRELWFCGWTHGSRRWEQ